MLLNLEQLCTITQGVTHIKEEEGKFRFFRFTEKQSDAHLEAGKTELYNRTFATSGVRLVFRTNSRKLSFNYFLTPASSRRFAWFDVYENGAMRRHFGND